VIHTSVHQPVDDKVPGLSLGMFGQYFGRHESWGEMARPWIDYLARTSLMLQQGRNVADVAYFFGEEAPLTGLYASKPVPDAPKAHSWDFLNPDALLNALSVEGNEVVTPGGARYRAIQLGGTSRAMTLPVLRKLASLVEAGATVVGLPPQDSPSLADDRAEWSALVARLWPGTDRAQVGKGQVFAMADIDAALAAMGVAPGMRLTGASEGAHIPYVHRRLADGDSFFLVNQRDRTETVEARFRVTGKAPELWNAETGTVQPVSYRFEGDETIVPLTLHADDSVHVVFRKPVTAPALTVTPPTPAAAADLSGPWTVAFQPGRGAPAAITLDRLVSLDQHADPGVKYFSGEATYSRDFTPPKGWKPGQPLWLNLGEAREVAEVRVNGQHAGWAWRAPYRVDLSSVTRKGRNRLEIRVANLWVNRLIGDRQPGAQKVTWTAMPTYLPDAPLRPSGLIGPVTLETAYPRRQP
ncbi:MAG: glycosyl hydrolase, partial [Alteraurantiacibacter sp.]|nr:glycosyl hydrolase [Alteraurantiacibacter sp.]